MKHFVWLLFLPGLLCNFNPLIIRPDSLVTWEGSCVVIPCQIGQYNGADLHDISLLWYFQPFYDQTDYSGILLYNSSATPNTQSRSASEPRVDFIGDIKQKNCDLKISPVGTEHDGMYGARMFASYYSGGKQEKENWFVNATVKVAESPPEPTMHTRSTDITESIISSITVTCSVPYHCPSAPLRLTFSGLQTYGWWSPARTAIRGGVITTVANFPVTSEDHGKTLVCSLKQWDWSEISRSTMQLAVKCRSSCPSASAGTYYCIARNSIGSLKSSPVVLDVLYAPKGVQLTIENQSLLIKEGDTFTLNCSFNKSNPSDGIRYRWYKANSALSHQGNLLTFNSATLEEAGDYRCEVCNDVSCSSSPSVTVDIHFALKDVKVVQEPGARIYEGNRVTLRCEVPKANPEVSSYRWFKDGVQQGSDSAPANLTISHVTPEHSGRYSCDAQNSVAVSSSNEITLSIYYGPRKVRLSLQTWGDVTEGMDVALRCDAEANPPPNRFEFYRDEGKILETSERILILRKVQVEDAGGYSCKADNGISAAESETLSLAVSSAVPMPGPCSAEAPSLLQQPSVPTATPEGQGGSPAVTQQRPSALDPLQQGVLSVEDTLMNTLRAMQREQQRLQCRQTTLERMVATMQSELRDLKEQLIDHN